MHYLCFCQLFLISSWDTWTVSFHFWSLGSNLWGNVECSWSTPDLAQNAEEYEQGKCMFTLAIGTIYMSANSPSGTLTIRGSGGSGPTDFGINKKVCVWQTHHQGLCQLFLTLSWDTWWCPSISAVQEATHPIQQHSNFAAQRIF